VFNPNRFISTCNSAFLSFLTWVRFRKVDVDDDDDDWNTGQGGVARNDRRRSNTDTDDADIGDADEDLNLWAKGIKRESFSFCVVCLFVLFVIIYTQYGFCQRCLLVSI